MYGSVPAHRPLIESGAAEQTFGVNLGARQQCDVIVVGAGPTGLMLTSELALAGVAVQVLERQVAPSGQSRGGGINSACR